MVTKFSCAIKLDKYFIYDTDLGANEIDFYNVRAKTDKSILGETGRTRGTIALGFRAIFSCQVSNNFFLTFVIF